jgi:hypothetical protein
MEIQANELCLDETYSAVKLGSAESSSSSKEVIPLSKSSLANIWKRKISELEIMTILKRKRERDGRHLT